MVFGRIDYRCRCVLVIVVIIIVRSLPQHRLILVMARLHLARTASLAISLLGALVNFTFALQLLFAWRSLKWEPESEWEGSENSWRGDGVKLVWGLLSAYFAAAATVCIIGFTGIVKSIPSFVRFYRDYSIADFAFCTFFTFIGTYAAFRTSLRGVACQEFARQPDLMREMAAMGLNLENCELWFERAVLASLVVMVVLVVIRIHFLIALSNYYSYLSRHQSAASLLPIHMFWRDDSLQHPHQPIYLLPRNPVSPFATSTSPTSTPTPPSKSTDDILIYAPVPLSSMTPQQARDLRASATEAWVSRVGPCSSSSSLSSSLSSSCQSVRSHRHGHRHHHHHRSASGVGSEVTGRISLPVKSDEGLLPTLPRYEESAPEALIDVKA
jgi:hypothetical protein